jgi:solute carrier family 25 protein 39/40
LGEYVTPRVKCRYFDPITGVLRQQRKITKETSPGTLRMLRAIFAREGLSGIYSGLAPTLVMGVPNTIIYFYTYEELAYKLRQEYPSGRTVPAIAGASARFLASLSTSPFELLRTRQAARVGAGNTQNIGMISEFRTMIQNEGASSLFRGTWPTLFRDVPFSAVYWMVVETMRDTWGNQHHGQQQLSAWVQAGQALTNGCVSGMIAAAVTTPLDVVKTRIQVGTQTVVSLARSEVRHASQPSMCNHGGALAAYHEGLTSSSNSGQKASQSILQIARNIMEEEGVAGFWRGNTARMMKVAPACAIMITTYEIGKRVLN